MRIAWLAIALLSLPVCAEPAAASTPRVFSVAGSGAPKLSGDGLPATDAGGEFRDVAPLPHGGFLVSGDAVVRRVDARGIVTTVAGDGSFNEFERLGDGGPATRASLDPEGLAVLPGGGFLVADPGHGRVRMVSAQGTIGTVAGGAPANLPSTLGPFAPKGDGGPATSATLDRPDGVAVLPGGGYLIADTGDNRVRRVDARGIITTVAGTGAWQVSGDGGPATAAGLSQPSALAVLPHGGFLVAEAGGRIRQVDARGTITTVAGGGRGGDGGPARRAELQEPRGLVALPRGGFLIAEAQRVRRVDARGRIATLAGVPHDLRAGQELFTIEPARAPWSGLSDGLGGPASDARLGPTSLAREPDGSVLVGEGTHVLVLATGSHPPPAVAIRPPAIVGGRLHLAVAASEPGRERIVVRTAHGGRRVVSIARLVRAGVTDFGMPALPSGGLVVRVVLRGGGPIATDETALVAGRVLSSRLARAAIASYCCEGRPALRRSLRARQAEEAPYMTPSVYSCRRFASNRVDCRWGSRDECLAGASAILRDAVLRLEMTASCGYERRLRHHTRPWIVPLL